MKNSKKKPGIMKLIAGILFTILGFVGINYFSETQVIVSIVFYLMLVAGAALMFVFVDEFSSFRNRRCGRNKKLEVL